jgi:activating signal cointegrator complex subunit 3
MFSSPAPLQDASLRHTLQFGIGLHHAGLADSDRKCCEALFVAGKIQVHT